MGAFYVERRVIADMPDPSLARDIVHHLYSRGFKDKTIVVTPDPPNLMGPVRKSWLKLLRVVQRERASTLRPDLIRELTGTAADMRNLVFTTKPPSVFPAATVFFIKEDQLTTLVQEYRTVYLARPISEANYLLLGNWVAEGGLVVVYE